MGALCKSLVAQVSEWHDAVSRCSGGSDSEGSHPLALVAETRLHSNHIFSISPCDLGAVVVTAMSPRSAPQPCHLEKATSYDGLTITREILLGLSCVSSGELSPEIEQHMLRTCGACPFVSTKCSRITSYLRRRFFVMYLGLQLCSCLSSLYSGAWKNSRARFHGRRDRYEPSAEGLEWPTVWTSSAHGTLPSDTLVLFSGY